MFGLIAARKKKFLDQSPPLILALEIIFKKAQHAQIQSTNIFDKILDYGMKTDRIVLESFG